MPEPGQPRAELVATYRWQLTPERGFLAAAEAAGDLAALGVSHLYLSPVVEAVPGSTHGYDAVDPTQLREELGGERGFRALAEACATHGLGIVVDVVPNHLAAHPANPWWWKVLRLGPRSRWAHAFDVDWDPPKRELRERILLPVLGDHYGRELEAGNLRVERGDGTDARLLVIRYHDHEFPVSPAATAAVLAGASRRAHDDVLGVAARVLARVEDETVDLDARDADLLVAERTALARLADPGVAAALDAELEELNADVDRLDLFLDRQQHHRLARWRVGQSELDYRRFFDVDTLVAIRVEEPDVFEAVHGLPLRLAEEGLVDGLRIDHVDGLRDPTGYVAQLRSSLPDGAWLLVEKILRPGEDLPEAWAGPVDGTTGYEVADLLGGWLTDPDGAAHLTKVWREAVGEEGRVEDVVAQARRLVLATSLSADVERVTDAMVRVCEGRRRHRDHARDALRAALVEVAAHAPAYRSYVREVDGALVASPADETFVRTAVDSARSTAPDVDPELLDLVEAVLLGRLRGECETEVALRFQQLTGPVAAKGEEDTALYRWLALPHRCEVGADPGVPYLDASAWHAACAAAQRRWPRRMTTLSTHDTKRAADVRARLAAMTTVPDEVAAAWSAWWSAAGEAGDPRAAWLVFHTLVGAHPLPLERAWPAVEKSLREAKLATSWTAVDDAYEAEVRTLVERSVRDPELGRHVATLADRVADAGRAGALAQLLAQLLAPGVPDVYQGSEGWDLSLVDPDNRRGIAPDRRRELLAAAAASTVADAFPSDAARAALVRTALAVRRRHHLDGYVPLAATGPDADRVLAFGRGEPAEVLVVAARPGPGARIEADAAVALPDGRWTDALGGGDAGRELDLGARRLPLALLERATP